MSAGEIIAKPELILCFMFVGITAGLFTTYVLSRVAPNVPYTVIIFFLGMLFGVIGMESAPTVLSVSIFQWNKIEPGLLLFVFLPALTFGDAMSINTHHLKKTFQSSVLLAGPGTVVGTLLMSVLLKFTMPFGWSWKICNIIGAILCASDTVAVLTLLRSAGVSPKLTTLFVQESMYNDGAALVMFELFYDMILIEPHFNYDTVGATLYFIRVIFISPLLGICFGLGTCLGLSVANRRTNSDDVTIQVVLTLSCAYLSFFVGQYVIGVSGILCCCVAGITIAFFGTPLFLELHNLHNIWKTLEWVGNTLIFLLAGMFIGIGSYSTRLEGRDFAMIFVIYLFIQIIRTVITTVCFPLFIPLGCRITVRECVFLTWGGLRGAVAATLALLLLQSSEGGKTVVLKHESQRIFLLIGGAITLTLLINATTSTRLIAAMKLVETDSNAVRMMQQYARNRIHSRVRDLVVDLQDELPAYNDGLVAEFCKVMVDNSVLHHSTDHAPSSQPAHSTGIDPRSKIASTLAGYRATHAAPEPEVGSPSMRRRRSSINPIATEGFRHRTMTLMSSKLPTLSTGGAEMLEMMFSPNVEDEVEDEEEENGVDQYGTVGNLPSFDSLSPRSAVVGRTSDKESSGKGRMGGADGGTGGHVPATGRGNEEEEKNDVIRLDRGVSALSSKNLIVHARQFDSVPKNIAIPQRHSSTGMIEGPSGRRPTKRMGPQFKEADKELLMHIRTVFLNLVKGVYWNHIKEGKLPRNSTCALALLYSIDVALDSLYEPGFADWPSLQPTLKNTIFDFLKPLARLLDVLYEAWMFVQRLFVPSDARSSRRSNKTRRGAETFGSKLDGVLDNFRMETTVYLLSSFIAAHEHAQKKIVHYLGETKKAEMTEVVMVIQASKANVKAARELLDAIDPDVVSYNVSKQVSRILLHSQQEMVDELEEEGVLRPIDATVLQIETARHYRRLEREWILNPLANDDRFSRASVGHLTIHERDLQDKEDAPETLEI